MYAKRVDNNQVEIVACLRKLGATVVDLSKCGKGIPDLMIGYNGATVLIEIKSGSKAKFTSVQIDFMKKWNGGLIFRVETIDDCINIINDLR